MLCKISYLAKFSEILAKLTKTELSLAKIMGELSFLMGKRRNWRRKRRVSNVDEVVTLVSNSGACPQLEYAAEF